MQLVYSTFSHGISLRTMYRNMLAFGDTPVLLVVRDDCNKVCVCVRVCVSVCVVCVYMYV